VRNCLHDNKGALVVEGPWTLLIIPTGPMFEACCYPFLFFFLTQILDHCAYSSLPFLNFCHSQSHLIHSKSQSLSQQRSNRACQPALVHRPGSLTTGTDTGLDWSLEECAGSNPATEQLSNQSVHPRSCPESSHLQSTQPQPHWPLAVGSRHLQVARQPPTTHPRPTTELILKFEELKVQTPHCHDYAYQRAK